MGISGGERQYPNMFVEHPNHGDLTLRHHLFDVDLFRRFLSPLQARHTVRFLENLRSSCAMRPKRWAIRNVHEGRTYRGQWRAGDLGDGAKLNWSPRSRAVDRRGLESASRLRATPRVAAPASSATSTAVRSRRCTSKRSSRKVRAWIGPSMRTHAFRGAT